MRLLSLLSACALALPALSDDPPAPPPDPEAPPAKEAPAPEELASGTPAVPSDPAVAIAKGDVKSSAAPAAARAGALLKLGETRHPEALAVLVAALSDPDPSIRLAAVKGLRLLGDPAAAKSVAPLVSEAKPEAIPVKVEYDRVDLMDPDLRIERGAVLEGSTTVDRSLDLRREAALTLGRLGSVDGVEALVGCLPNAPSELSAVAVESLELLANRRLDPAGKTPAEAWAAWRDASKGTERSAWVLEGFQAHFKKAGREVADLSGSASLQTLAAGLVEEEPWIRANAQACLLDACERAEDEAAIASLMDVLSKAAQEEAALAKPRDAAKDPAKAARVVSARRALGRTFLRLALRYARVKGIPSEERPLAGILTRLTPSAGNMSGGPSFDPLDLLCDWWRKARAR